MNKNIFEMLNIGSDAVCPARYSDGLDLKLRRLLQNPVRFLKPYVHEGMDVLDLGCGSGFCTLDIAHLIGDSGTVVAADLQLEMLDKTKDKIERSGGADNIRLHECAPNSIGIEGKKFDFIVVFYVFHEMPDHAAVLNELESLLKPRGRILISEPLFHVPRAAFGRTLRMLEAGFEIVERPRIFFSRSVVLMLKNK